MTQSGITLRAAVGLPYRKCQMVFMPSFQSEVAVYIVIDDDTDGLVVVKQIRPQLWYAMNKELKREADGEWISDSPQRDRRALDAAQVEVVSSKAVLDRATVELLENIWTELLSELRYPTGTKGDDGTYYHAAHYVNYQGHRAGKIWSPSGPSSVSDYVAVAEALRDYAVAEGHTRDAAKSRLREFAIELQSRF